VLGVVGNISATNPIQQKGEQEIKELEDMLDDLI
jgi:hypothetical protein